MKKTLWTALGLGAACAAMCCAPLLAALAALAGGAGVAGFAAFDWDRASWVGPALAAAGVLFIGGVGVAAWRRAQIKRPACSSSTCGECAP